MEIESKASSQQHQDRVTKSGGIGMPKNPFDASRSFFLLDDNLEINYKSLEEITAILQNLVPQDSFKSDTKESLNLSGD